MSFFGNYFGPGAAACDYPAEGDVREGVEYGSGVYTGTLAVPGAIDPSLPMLHSPADVVRWLLVDLGYGTDPADAGAWPIFVSAEPSIPSNCVTCYDTQGLDGGRISTTGERIEQPGVQIRVRGNDHATSYEKAMAIATAIDETVYQNTVTIDGTSYSVHQISRGQILAMGRDGVSARMIHTINLICTLGREQE